MLQLAANQFLESIGDTHFIASPDYLEWANTNCLDIAIKRKPKWIWQDTKYFYDHMSINDLIDSPLTGDMSIYLSKPEPINPDFSWHSSHDINSKVGGSIASLVSLDISASDVVSVSIDISGMEKQSIDFHAVTEALKTKKINLNSDYIRNIANNKHNIICLVTQYLYLTKKTEMKVSINWDISEEGGDKHVPEASISEDGKMHYVKSKSMVFDVGTRLAFDFLEILIHPDGSFELLERSEESSSLVMIPKLPKISKEVHSDNVHSIKNIDIADGDKAGHLPTASDKPSQPLDSDKSLGITRDLLTIAINDKAVLKSLDSFMESTQGSITVDLSVFKKNQDVNLAKLLKCIGVEIDVTSTADIQCSTLNYNMIHVVLEKIGAIDHLELPYLKNILSIIEEGNTELMTLLIDYLQNLKKDSSGDNTSNREKLLQDGKVKLLLLTIGVTKTKTKLNKYSEPVFILLHGS